MTSARPRAAALRAAAHACRAHAHARRALALRAAALAFPLALVGCDEAYFTTPVDVPDEPPRLVAFGLFEPGVPWTVYVSQSTSLGSRVRPGPLQSATVEVFQGTTLVERLAYEPASDDAFYSGGRYVGATVPAEGQAYTLRVSAPSLPTATGSSRTPAPVVPRVAETTRVGVRDQYSTLYTVALDVPDPAGPTFYRLRATAARRTPNGWYEASQQVCSADPVLRQSLVDVDLGNAGQACFGTEGALFSDETFDGQTRRLPLRLSVYRQDAGGAQETRVTLHLERLSDDAYRFERTRRLAELAGDNPFAEPLDLYGNLDGGLGVFAGFATARVPLVLPE